MNLFERYLSVWVGLCIIAGVLPRQFLPGVFHAIARLEMARVNIPVVIAQLLRRSLPPHRR